MKAKETRSDPIKKVVYYLDEAIIFIVMVLSILFSETIIKSIKTGSLPNHLTPLSWVHVVIASFIGIFIYGMQNDSFKYEYDKKKPSMIKRCYNAMVHGLFYKTFIDMVD